jgi:hypothetical protein
MSTGENIELFEFAPEPVAQRRGSLTSVKAEGATSSSVPAHSTDATTKHTFNHTSVHINGWTVELENLLIAWAEKASGYAWLHNRSITLYKNRNMYLAVPAAMFAYTSASVTLLTSQYSNAEWRTIVAGLGSLISGMLIQFQELFTFKELSEQHRLSQLGFLSFFRDISCELSIPKRQRREASEYVTLKRLEMDKLLDHAPDIPPKIIEQFDAKFGRVNTHKPDVVSRLQTVIPHNSPKPPSQTTTMKNTTSQKQSKINLDFRPGREVDVSWEARTDVSQLIEIANSDTHSDRDSDVETEQGDERESLFPKSQFNEEQLVLLPNSSSPNRLENDGSAATSNSLEDGVATFV